MNWQLYFVWVQIEAAVKCIGWSPSSIVHYLKATNPSGVFNALYPSVIGRWITKIGGKGRSSFNIDRLATRNLSPVHQLSFDQ